MKGITQSIKDIVLLVLFMHIWSVGYGQTLTYEQNPYLDGNYRPMFNFTPNLTFSRDFLPPSPSAASLGSFGQIPVGNYTGVAEINIPLYEINYKDLSVPISIKYHTSGNKPSSFPGSVGLGWAMQAGGSITRIINGIPDKGAAPLFGKSLLFSDPRLNENWTDLSKLEFYMQGNHLTFLSPEKGVDARWDTKDLDPDLYYFNINGHSGSFYLDHTNTIQIQSTEGKCFFVKMNYMETTITFPRLHQGREPIYHISDPYNNEVSMSCIGGFTVIDTDGIEYTFGGTSESIEFSRPGFRLYQEGNINDQSYIQPTTWHLMKIKSPNEHSIEFKYQQQTVITKARFTDFAVYSHGGQDFKTALKASDRDAVKSTLINSCNLVEITTPISKVSFSNSVACDQLDYTDKSDYYSNTLSYNEFYFYDDVRWANTEKKINNKLDPDYKEVRSRFFPLKLDLITVFNSHNELIRKYKFNYTDNVNTRLKLLSISNIDGEESYSFKYNSQSLSPYLVGAEDHYGFHNGIYMPDFNYLNASDNTILLYPNSFFENQKKPNSEYALSEILNTIVYPTKGYTVFEYEPNTYGSTYQTYPFKTVENSSGNEETGGIRINAIKNYDHNGQMLTFKKYHYVKDFFKNGISSSGVLAYIPQYQETYNDKVMVKKANGIATVVGKLQMLHRTSSNTIYPMIMQRGNHVTYSEVTVEDSNNGFTVYKYKNYDNGYVDKASLSYVSNILSDDDKGETGIVEFGKKEEVISMVIERGQLLSESVYDKNKNIKREINYFYNDDEDRFNQNVRYIKYSPNAPSLTGFSSYRLVAGVHYTYFPFLKKRLIKDFLNGIVINEEEYTYNEKYRLLKSKMIKDNNEKNIFSEILYPFDFNEKNSLYEKMMNNHLYSYPIEKIQKIDNKQTTRDVYKYSIGLVSQKPDIIKLHQSFRQYQNLPLLLDATIGYYDSLGNPLYITKDDATHTVYLWSYGGQYLIAGIQNATYSEISSILGEDFIEKLPKQSFLSNADKNKIDDLRSQLPNALVTSYTYRPLVGMLTLTDPRGVITYYDYDDFGRLKWIKDHDGNKIKEYKYNYSNK